MLCVYWTKFKSSFKTKYNTINKIKCVFPQKKSPMGPKLCFYSSWECSPLLLLLLELFRVFLFVWYTKGTREPINQEIRLKIQEKRIQMSKALTKFKLSLSTFFNRTWSVGIKYINLKHKIMIFVNFAKFRPTLLIWVQKNGCYGHNWWPSDPIKVPLGVHDIWHGWLLRGHPNWKNP